MKISEINARIDAALYENRRAELLVLLMAAGIFLLGFIGIIAAYWMNNPYLSGGSAVVTAFLYWPIREILKLRRDNIYLKTVPVMISELSRPELANEIRKMIKHLQGAK
jgi:hypothetical protein